MGCRSMLERGVAASEVGIARGLIVGQSSPIWESRRSSP